MQLRPRRQEIGNPMNPDCPYASPRDRTKLARSDSQVVIGPFSPRTRMTTQVMTRATADAGERTYFDPIETAPRAELRRIQTERLLEQLAFVGERSPLIRKVWADAGVAVGDIASIEDFIAKAPFIDKDSLRAWRDAHQDAFGGVL